MNAVPHDPNKMQPKHWFFAALAFVGGTGLGLVAAVILVLLGIWWTVRT
jgi:uncharacterized protein involved in exopolysaccharide biosynthesis